MDGGRFAILTEDCNQMKFEIEKMILNGSGFEEAKKSALKSHTFYGLSLEIEPEITACVMDLNINELQPAAKEYLIEKSYQFYLAFQNRKHTWWRRFAFHKFAISI